MHVHKIFIYFCVLEHKTPPQSSNFLSFHFVCLRAFTFFHKELSHGNVILIYCNIHFLSKLLETSYAALMPHGYEYVSLIYMSHFSCLHLHKYSMSHFSRLHLQIQQLLYLFHMWKMHADMRSFVMLEHSHLANLTSSVLCKMCFVSLKTLDIPNFEAYD